MIATRTRTSYENLSKFAEICFVIVSITLNVLMLPCKDWLGVAWQAGHSIRGKP
jgi:hypothetical protein